MKFLFVLLMLLPISSAAQTALSLDEFRREVVEYSNRMQMAINRQRVAQERRQAAHTALLPEMSLSADADYLLRDRSDYMGAPLRNYNYSAAVTLSQSVWTGGEARNNYRIAQLNELIAAEEVDMEHAQVVLMAEEVYWRVAAADERLEVAHRYEQIVERLYEVVQVRYGDGYVAKNDLLMISTRLNEARLQRLDAEQLRKTLMLQMNNMMGLDYTDYILVDTISAPVILPPLVALTTALGDRADYERASLTVRMRDNEVALTRSRFNPHLSLGARAQLSSSLFNGAGEWDGVLFARLNIPIFAWGARKRSVAAARYATVESEYARRAVVDEIALNLAESLTAIEHTSVQLSVATSNLSAATENLSLSTFAYTEGRIPILDVLQSQLSWIQAYTSYLDVHCRLKIASVEYRYAAGLLEP